jgi:hypothetical protein
LSFRTRFAKENKMWLGRLIFLTVAFLMASASGFVTRRAPGTTTAFYNAPSRRMSISDSKTAETKEVTLPTIEDDEDNPYLMQQLLPQSTASVVEGSVSVDSFSYVQFAQKYPFANNLMIATAKTAAADLLAQTVIAGTPLMEVDLQRSFLFCLFGCLYLGAFQYMYQVNIFKRLFDVDKFTTQPWKDKLQDIPGLKALGAQTGLDLTVLTLIYLPTFYIFKASVFSGSLDPSVWVSSGLDTYTNNFSKDESDLLMVWLPADLVCFSVPLYLRLPVRHIVSFVWTAYLSFARGGH